MKIIGFLNSYCSGLSGGDVRFIEIMKRVEIKNLLIVTSILGEKKCKQLGLYSDFIITSHEKNFKNVIVTYLIRIIKTIILQLKTVIDDNDIIYSSSDFLPDILPAFILKCKNLKSKWIVCIFLIIPSPIHEYIWRFYPEKYQKGVININLVFYYVSQQICIFLAKHCAYKILVPNIIDKQYLVERNNISPLKIEIALGGVDLLEFDEIKDIHKKYEGIFLARFHQQKGIFDLIDIWEIVCKIKKDAKICIIGGGEPDVIASINNYISSKNLISNFELVGYVSNQKKIQLLKSGKIFIYPSYYESFGIVIAEAMACGLPVIAYDLPIYEEIYKDQIILIPRGEFNMFAKKIIYLLENENKQKIIGQQGRGLVEDFDWPKIASKEMDYLNVEGGNG